MPYAKNKYRHEISCQIKALTLDCKRKDSAKNLQAEYHDGVDKENPMRQPLEKGWTLVELLITVAVLAILGAIALVQFTSYRMRTFNAAAESDLANMRIIEQAMAVEHQDFGGAAVTTASITLVGADINTLPVYINLSSRVRAGAKVLPSGGKNITFVAVTKHTNANYAYGADQESQVIYREEIAPGTALQDSDIPDATTGADFTSPWSAAN